MDNEQIKYAMTSVPLELVRKAKDRDAISQLELGKAYYYTTSIENHGNTAFEWIHSSAEQGNMEAQFKLGDLYALGYGTEKSLPDSYKWYTKAAIQGYKKALIRIHNLYQEDIKMHCRGKLNDRDSKMHPFRELYESRLDKHKSILNYAIKYYSDLFASYQSLSQNNTNVQLNLAFLYQHGYGTKKCSRWAFEYYLLAAEQGDINAQYNLGCLYHQNTKKKFNYRDAFKWYTKSAQGGHIAAQRCLAYFYLKGLAIDVDYEIAISWYTKAAGAGDSQAQVTLGMLYRKGDYIKQDLSEAINWYTLAARQGNIVAKNCLSKLHKRGMLIHMEIEEDILKYLSDDSMNSTLCSKLSVDISKLEDIPEFKQLNKLAKHALVGDGPAMYEIGLNYYNGDKGFPQDKDIGLAWIKHAANAKYKNAGLKLADLYKNGDVIEQDYHKAFIWYRAVATKKNSEAQFNIGFMYKKGLGVRRDRLEASKWFTWAADQGDSNAQYCFVKLRYHGQGIKKDKEEAVECFYKLVRLKNIQASYKLGHMFFSERGHKEEYKTNGLRLLEFAAKNGHTSAQRYLGKIFSEGEGVNQDISKSIQYYTMAADSGDKYSKYGLAISYLSKDCTTQEYIYAYCLFKQLKGRSGILDTPLASIPRNISCSKVIEMFTVVTENGVEDLNYNLGCLYGYGMDDYEKEKVDTNYSKAEKYYLLASKKGDGRADYCLGIMYEYGKGVQKNLTIATDYYNRAIEKENDGAMYRLACFYLQGNIVTQDLLKAFHFFTNASTMGNKNARVALDILRKKDPPKTGWFRIVKKDPDIPITRKNKFSMLEKATEEGYTRLQYQLGVMYEQKNDYLNAFKWFSLAAEIGITDAYYKLGVIFEESKGIEQSYATAASMYQRATERDHEDACYRLGQLYQYGNGVEQNYSKAYSLYNKAVEMNHDMASKVLNIRLETKIQSNGKPKKDSFNQQLKEYLESLLMCTHIAEYGNTEEQFKVGYAYENNYSSPKYADAYKWYSMASKNSHKDATYHLGLLYEKGLGVSQDYHKAIQLYNQASQLGSDDALHRLGIVNHHGKGLETNPIKAIEYYINSAQRGNPKYQCELGRLYEEGEIVPKDILKALKWYTKAYIQGYDNIEPKLYAMYDDEPYENFFWKKLFQILSVASCNPFDSDENGKYEHCSNVNFRLGTLYFYGQGTKKSLNRALTYLMKRYKFEFEYHSSFIGFLLYDGFTSSQKNEMLEEFDDKGPLLKRATARMLYKLGMIYRDGVMEKQNTVLSYMNQFSKFGKNFINYQRQFNPDENTIIEKNYLKSFKYFKKAAKEKHAKALLQLGIMYHCGYGVDIDIGKGEKNFKSVANISLKYIGHIAKAYHIHNGLQNFSKAYEWYKHLEKLFNETPGLSDKDRKRINLVLNSGLGLLYEYGDGVEQDYQTALEYYKKLAAGNSIMYTYNLALMYYHGKGVPADYDEAFKLFNKGFSPGFPKETSIAFAYYENNLCTNDSKRNLIYCNKSERNVLSETHYYLGLMYKNGQGVLKDEVRAQRYFENAVSGGCKRAENEIEEDILNLNF